MSGKSSSYHLEIQTHGKNPYGVIRTSYRDEGKVKHKNLCRLGVRQIYGLASSRE